MDENDFAYSPAFPVAHPLSQSSNFEHLPTSSGGTATTFSKGIYVSQRMDPSDLS